VGDWVSFVLTSELEVRYLIRVPTVFIVSMFVVIFF